MAIRRDRLSRAGLRELVRNGTAGEPLAAFLAALVKARKNLLISGGTAVGKTTMLRALASAIPPDERLITIEDSLELCLDWDTAAHPDVVAMQSREPNTEGEGEITLAELVRWALRMTPDRVLVGEVRGAEVIPMLNAMSQGNDGSMTTIHASSSRGAMLKLAAYAAQSPEHLTLEDTGLLIAGAIHFVIQLAWDASGARCVSSIREITDADGRQVASNEVWSPARTAAPSRRSRSAPPPWRNSRPPATGPDRGRRHERRDRRDPRRPGRAGRDPRHRRAAPHRHAGAEPAPEPAGGPGPAGGDHAPRRRDPGHGGGRRRRHPVAGRDGAGRAGGVVPSPGAGTGPRRTRGRWSGSRRSPRSPRCCGTQSPPPPGWSRPSWPPSRSPRRPIREQVVLLAARIRRGQRLPHALRAFAAETADPTADLVVAALLLAAEQQARDLAQLLGSLADSARQHAVMRMRVAAGRARVRTAARIIIAVTLLLVIGLLAWSRAFLQPYGTPAGQLMLLVVGACFTAGFWWLHRISVMGSDPRLLTNLAAHVPG